MMTCPQEVLEFDLNHPAKIFLYYLVMHDGFLDFRYPEGMPHTEQPSPSPSSRLM